MKNSREEILEKILLIIETLARLLFMEFKNDVFFYGQGKKVLKN